VKSSSSGGSSSNGNAIDWLERWGVSIGWVIMIYDDDLMMTTMMMMMIKRK